MSLRTRLIIAFLLLSVLPLSAVTVFSYQSQILAFEDAARREASQSATDIGRRMERITADVGRRMDRLFVSPPSSTGATGSSSDMRGLIAPMLGETAPLVERMEFHPSLPPEAPPPPAPPIPGVGPPEFGPPPPSGTSRPRGRGRGRPPWLPLHETGPAVPTEIIVVDVEKAMEEARRLARAEVQAQAPALAPLVEE